MIKVYLPESVLTLFNKSDEGESCGAVALDFGMVMAGDHLSHLSSSFSLSRKLLPLVAKIPGVVGVAKAMPP